MGAWRSARSFWRESEAARGFARALHFRYATHGDRGADNTHPFRIGERLGVAHNGRLEQVDRSSDPRRSDTWHFARSYLGPIALADPEFPFGRGWRELLEGFAGDSRLVFLGACGRALIVNEAAGEWVGGAWYSNGDHDPERARARRIEVGASLEEDHPGARSAREFRREGVG